MRRSENEGVIAKLCPDCGFCCNGVLFSDVKIAPADRLALSGIGCSGVKSRLPQPCPAYNGKLCTIYDHRPSPCRKFDCLLVQRVAAGKLEVAKARQKITEAKAVVAEIERLLARMGQADPSIPLSRRFSNVMAEPIDLASTRQTSRDRSRLADAVDQFAKCLTRHFVG